MLATGASISRAVQMQGERVERLKLADDVEAPKPPAETHSALDEDTRGALQRFARFITKEKPKKKPETAPKKGLPAAYVSQIELAPEGETRGSGIDIYV